MRCESQRKADERYRKKGKTITVFFSEKELLFLKELPTKQNVKKAAYEYLMKKPKKSLDSYHSP